MRAAKRPVSKILTRIPQPVPDSAVRQGDGAARPDAPGTLGASGFPGPAVARVGLRAGRTTGTAGWIMCQWFPPGLLDLAAGRGDAAVAVAAERITVYPARFAGDRWRAAWKEPDGHRGQCEAVSAERLAARLEPVA